MEGEEVLLNDHMENEPPATTLKEEVKARAILVAVLECEDCFTVTVRRAWWEAKK